MAFTTTDLLARIRAQGQLPDANGALSSADILAMAKGELETLVWPELRSVRGEYGIETLDYALVADQSDYDIPTRAQGMMLRDLTFHPQGADKRGVSLSHIPYSESELWRDQNSGDWQERYAFTLVAGRVRLLPTPKTAGSAVLRMHYYLRQGELVEPSACDLVTAITASQIQLSTSSVFGVNATADVVDLVKADPPFTYGHVEFSSTYNSGAPNYWSTDATIQDMGTLGAAGAYVCQAGQTCVPSVPPEFFNVLVWATLVPVFEALGDQAAMQNAGAMTQRHLQSAIQMVSPRVDGAPKVIVNTSSPLRAGRYRR